MPVLCEMLILINFKKYGGKFVSTEFKYDNRRKSNSYNKYSKVKKITEGLLTSRRRARERPNLLREVLLRAVIKILNIQRITAKSLIKNSLNRLKTSRL